ncbi:hypothetical protein BC938DRAFT_477109 [Jimgerdemannia flammicorona]|uniref:Uncharacterized protein n=1 Tax=Jimgerdemannia flammicorona TaxID=994334 RepID=A0A433PBZ2_9FUNG|nr:hypothetical protein BC938DRAFT_477109 [Jimgerdemannia flammicorona]
MRAYITKTTSMSELSTDTPVPVINLPSGLSSRRSSTITGTEALDALSMRLTEMNFAGPPKIFQNLHSARFEVIASPDFSVPGTPTNFTTDDNTPCSTSLPRPQPSKPTTATTITTTTTTTTTAINSTLAVLTPTPPPPRPQARRGPARHPRPSPRRLPATRPSTPISTRPPTHLPPALAPPQPHTTPPPYPARLPRPQHLPHPTRLPRSPPPAAERVSTTIRARPHRRPVRPRWERAPRRRSSSSRNQNITIITTRRTTTTSRSGTLSLEILRSCLGSRPLARIIRSTTITMGLRE